MPVNPNESLKNRHLVAMGKTGSGKTYWMAGHPERKRAGVRLIVWDPYQSNDVPYAHSLSEFTKRLGVMVRVGGQVRLGLSVNPTKANFESFCRVVWAVADGKKDTVLVVEELADVTTSGGAAGTWGNIVRVGRKFGLIIMAATQRPQDIDKTIFTQVSKMWCGYISNYDQPYVERNLGLPAGELSKIARESYKHVLSDGDRFEIGGPGKMRY